MKKSRVFHWKKKCLFSFLRLRVESEERSAQKFYYRAGDETQGLDLEK